MDHRLTVAALYVDPRGIYPTLLGPECCWDAQRDATTYDGPWPIVAHPACGPWGKLRHQYRGSEGGPELALTAVWQCRQWGGVLEHPSHSLLWAAADLPSPGEPPDEYGGYTIDVNQCDWGHVARKRTWLYCVRVAREIADYRPPPREPTHWVSGRHTAYARSTKRYPGVAPREIKICSKAQRIRTPPAFAEWLILMAESAGLP